MTGLKTTPFKVGIQKDAITYIAGKNKNLTVDQVKNIISNVLSEILADTLLDLKLWIEHKVPKRTGQLRDNLQKNILSSRVKDFILRMIIRTSIDYASEVNKMTMSQVRHVHTWREHGGNKAYAYYYGHYGPILLDDPRAIGHFFDEMIKYAKERILVNMTKAKYKYQANTKITSQQMAKVGGM